MTSWGRPESACSPRIYRPKLYFSQLLTCLLYQGIEPPRDRKYLLRWREKFRNRQYGIGGDSKYVQDGKAEFRVMDLPSNIGDQAAHRKVVVNVAPGADIRGIPAENIVPVKGLSVKDSHTIVGPHVVPLKGGVGGQLIVREGLWEERRGRKIDGGERRAAEVQAKRRGEERRNAK